MYHKIVVPLDGSEQAEKVLPIAQNVLAPGGEVILLHILPRIPSGLSQVSWEASFSYSEEYRKQTEASDRSRWMNYLEDVRRRMGGALGGWRCAVEIAEPVAHGIVDFASKEEVDLIAMYTHDRNGLAKLIMGSIAEKVQRRTAIEVQVFKPRQVEWPTVPDP